MRDGDRVWIEVDGVRHTGRLHRRLMRERTWWVRFDAGRFPPSFERMFDEADGRHNDALCYEHEIGVVVAVD